MKNLGWPRAIGILFCGLLITSSFMNWAWYPDLQKFFTGFFSERNYYGKPGILLCFCAGFGLVFFIVGKKWSYRLNLLLSGICMAYGIANYFKYSSGYDGILPDKQAGIYLMLFSAVGFLIMSILATNTEKMDVPVKD